MNDAIFERLRRLLGAEGVERDPRGLPRAVPESDDALALICQAAEGEGWRFRLEGRGSWLPPDAPADFALSTQGINRVVRVSAPDLVVTVQAGATLEAVRAQLEPMGLWLAIDPPGRPDRTLGSIVATATAGPIRHGYGPIRDHVLGCTVVTGDGRLVDAGGRVVKNVAGFDLTKLHVGGFGAFGVITELNLRLRARPESDLTLLAHGSRHALTGAAHAARSADLGVVALELMAPALAAHPEWTLAVRLVGTREGLEQERGRLGRETHLNWDTLPADRAQSFWHLVARAPLGGELAIRLGALLDSLDDTVELVLELLGEGMLSAGYGTAALRWSGVAGADALHQLRRRAAEREIPVTLERAPWPLRHAVGHFGAYREGVGMLVDRLRDSFDPKGIIAVALEGTRE